jgi:hypothetical protein
MLDILIPETASAPPSARKRYGRRLAVLMPIFIVCFVAGVFLHPSALGLVLQAVGIISVGGVIYEFIVLVRALDELQHRIHMTALAIAGGVLASLATVWGLLATGLGLLGPNVTFALPAFGVLYYFALFLVSRRYA